MRVLLDAYFDNNFGDDLFVDILLKRYPDALFYTFWKNAPESVLSRAARFRNLVILPGGCALQENWPFDAFVMIGGDVLPDGVDYSERIARMKHVKECGGYVAMLGFSLYKEYGEKTIQDLKTMAELADTIVIRDHFSAERFKTLVPEAKVVEATDMVFAGRGQDCEKCRNQDTGIMSENGEASKPQILGIIPRRKLYSTDEEHLAYCKGQAAIADAYLLKYSQGKVRFLAYSTGEYDDSVTARDIIAQMKSAKQQVEIVDYRGDMEAFSNAIGECSALLPTRFHGLVFALMNRQPFVPIPYEVKLTQLLDELGYEGARIPYGEEITGELVAQAVNGLEKFGVLKDNIAAYEQKAVGFFEAMDTWSRRYEAYRLSGDDKLGENDEPDENASEYMEYIGTCAVEGRYPQVLCAAGEERKALQEENQMLTRQVEELNKWIESLQQQKADFEKKSQELEELRSQQAEQLLDKEAQLQGMEAQYQMQKQITEQRELELENQKNMATQQNDELMKWIESLKKERAAFERQNQELEGIRQWQWDQLMRVPLLSRKIESEYNSFLQTLREKLDKQSGL